MSAQDYPLFPVGSGKALPMVNVPIVKLFAQGVVAMWRETACRHHLWKLTALDDGQLRDLGIDRSDLAIVLKSPLSVNAVKNLEQLRAKRSA